MLPSSPQITPPTTVTTSSSMGSNLIRNFRVIQFVLNVICVTIASIDWDTFDKVLYDRTFFDGGDPSMEQKRARLFFLLVTIILMIASLALLLLFLINSNLPESGVLSPKLEAIYCGIGFVSLFIASVVVIAKVASLGRVLFFMYPVLLAGASLALINSGVYLASAIMMWKLSRPN